MSLNKAVRELGLIKGEVSAAGTITLGFGLKDGATGVGSCTLTDTSLYTFVWPRAFKEIPSVTVGLQTAGAMSVVTPSASGCTVRGETLTDGTTDKAIAFSIIAIGRQRD